MPGFATCSVFRLSDRESSGCRGGVATPRSGGASRAGQGAPMDRAGAGPHEEPAPERASTGRWSLENGAPPAVSKRTTDLLRRTNRHAATAHAARGTGGCRRRDVEPGGADGAPARVPRRHARRVPTAGRSAGRRLVRAARRLGDRAIEARFRCPLGRSFLERNVEAEPHGIGAWHALGGRGTASAGSA